ncbi:MAG: imidazoleglycerol-phosphate dehydratase HisB [Pirellulales bacterium]|nr:imidazoleglycerol-phosphate dehydratase HisB [Pirellulales bacterium]
MPRNATITRKTSETAIQLTIDLDGSGKSQVDTGIGFFDHMLILLAKHGCVDLEIKADGDLHVDQHHTVEDVGICLGQGVAQALGDKAGIRRYGFFSLPMEEALANVAIDLSGRLAFVYNADLQTSKIGDFDSQLVEEFFGAFAANALCNLHINVPYGRNGHHVSEAIFKCTARALRMAVEADDRMPGIPSTKGTLSS